MDFFVSHAACAAATLLVQHVQYGVVASSLQQPYRTPMSHDAYPIKPLGHHIITYLPPIHLTTLTASSPDPRSSVRHPSSSLSAIGVLVASTRARVSSAGGRG